MACQHYLQEVSLLHSTNAAFEQQQVWWTARLLRKCCRAWGVGSVPDAGGLGLGLGRCCGALCGCASWARQAMRTRARHPAVGGSCRGLGLGRVWEAAVLQLGSFPRCSSRMQFTMAENWLQLIQWDFYPALGRNQVNFLLLTFISLQFWFNRPMRSYDYIHFRYHLFRVKPYYIWKRR